MNRETLKKLRKISGLSQYELAKKANIIRSYYGLIENGKRNPSLLKAQRIAKSLNVEVIEAFPDEIFFAGKCYDMKLKEIVNDKCYPANIIPERR